MRPVDDDVDGCGVDDELVGVVMVLSFLSVSPGDDDVVESLSSSLLLDS